MPTSAKHFAVDTSVAVAALDGAHTAHQICASRVRQTKPALSGHAAFESFSVLTRMPGPLAIDAPTALHALATAFPAPCWLSAAQQSRLLKRIGTIGIVGGSTYDALVGEAARANNRVLLTRDLRAVRTYDALGIDYELVV